MSLQMEGAKIHFMGIGGIGMSALAQLVRARGALVSGCDREKSELTEALQQGGIPVAIGHDASHVADADLLVYTSAIPEDHPERRAARRSVRRGSFLARLLEEHRAIGICGTHGKTTTTLLTGCVLMKAGLDPTIFLGGVAKEMGTNFRLGSSDLFVAELDESDGTFLEANLSIAVVTNIEAEHLSHYFTFENVRRAFRTFARQVEKRGTLVVNQDDPEGERLWQAQNGPKISFGFRPGADLRASSIEIQRGYPRFTVEVRGERIGECTLQLPGRHNILNTLAALSVADALRLPLKDLLPAIEACRGVCRRIERVGTVQGVPVYSDYAHHPTEIRATLEAIRDLHPEGKILTAFQPHLYSRTRDFADEFGQELAKSDLTLLVELYPAREEPIEGVNSSLLVEKVRKAGGRVEGPYSVDALPAILRSYAPGFSTILCMGAGDIYKAATHVVDEPSSPGKHSSGR